MTITPSFQSGCLPGFHSCGGWSRGGVVAYPDEFPSRDGAPLPASADHPRVLERCDSPSLLTHPDPLAPLLVTPGSPCLFKSLVVFTTQAILENSPPTTRTLFLIRKRADFLPGQVPLPRSFTVVGLTKPFHHCVFFTFGTPHVALLVLVE